ncbi:MAG: ATP-dependent protease ATPase subunit HslU [Thermoanaerobaculales bacterium]|nr:ATP-dependent protease ATPase subunit HslU [Thermoanaerobaculales bacterium]
MRLDSLTPREIVAELDRFIVGQNAAKRAVAVALRNRWRRQQLDPSLREEVAPKNIIMIGPTGVGKTEIARRLSKLTGSPLLKVEASKFTEVGYVGRDVESIIRDLTDAAIQLVRDERATEVKVRAERAAEDRLLDLLVVGSSSAAETALEDKRRALKKPLRDGLLEDHEVEVEVSEQKIPTLEMFGPQGMESMGLNFKDMLGGMFGGKKTRKRMKVGEARRILVAEEEEKLIDHSQVEAEALKRVEEAGIVFLDEIDKIASRDEAGGHGGPDVSREGVQRDLLPIVEGTNVSTKYGVVRTDHILFIAAGAFHVSRPSDLIPELQGRFPIRVELSALDADDFVRILTEPENSLVRQYTELLRTEDVALQFSDEAVKTIATMAAEINSTAENIGARRLHTVLERLLEELSFEAPEIAGQAVAVTPDMVQERLGGLLGDRDLARYIL